MGIKSAGAKIFLIFIIVFMVWFTSSLYSDVYRNILEKNFPNRVPSEVQSREEVKIIEKEATQNAEDLDKLTNQEQVEKDKQEWLKNSTPDTISRRPCYSNKCASNEFNFKLISGAANVIGPSICFNDTILMKNSLNNVDRGMNVAVVDGKTGHLDKIGVFDLYSEDSEKLKTFLNKVDDQNIVLIASYDDAATRLDDEARKLLESYGSKKASSLAFRDNWIFMGGKKVATPKEGYEGNNKETNKYGDFPGAITIEGCVPRF